jgi:Signal transduction histidine kinase
LACCGGERAGLCGDETTAVSMPKTGAFDAELTVAELRDRIRLMTDMHDGAAATITSIVSQAEGARYAADIDAKVADEEWPLDRRPRPAGSCRCPPGGQCG